MKFTGEIGKKILKRTLVVAGTVAGISLVATLAKDEPEEDLDILNEETEEEDSEETESEEG